MRLVALIGMLVISGCDGPGVPSSAYDSPGAPYDGAPSPFTLELSTDLLTPKDVDSLRMVTTWRDLTSVLQSELGPAALQLPAPGAAVYGASSGTLGASITVWKGATPFTVARAEAAVPPSGTGVLRISISWLCAGTALEVAPGEIASTCPAGQSCRAGACRSDDRSGEALPEPDPPGTPTPACFDIARCMTGARVAMVNRASCTVAKAAGFLATNFAVVKPANSTGACTASQCLVALNPDAFEGWSDTGSVIALPPAVCAALDDGRASDVIMSDTCPSKTPAASLCNGEGTP